MGSVIGKIQDTEWCNSVSISTSVDEFSMESILMSNNRDDWHRVLTEIVVE